ncbi:MAG: N-acetyl-D-Glu racemase DgcA [SAR324 cluster bacterium]|jgi:L-alanine-DL-glutamate epimerase-like enolase superfamily enzyme|nr:N-acetyl-D-Glu racemase DgcA [SAR324 cluster bacterium]MED5483638.1 N-acetyl-D-Glu racemase DgcA [SAR324 cluster bacterium]
MTERKLNVHSENWSEEPFAISRGIDDNFDVVVVELEQNGFKAWGEATPTEHYNESISQTESLIEDFRNRIENGISRTELQQEMPKGAARNAVDCALWDLEAKHAGKRVWELPEISQHLGAETGSVPGNVTTVYSLGVDTPEIMGDIALKNANRPILKIKLTGDGDLERLIEIRKNAPESRLVIDANEAWTPEHYQGYVPEFKKLGVEMIEQPFPADNDGVLKTLDHPIPVCADESCHDTADLEHLVGLYEFVNIKLDKTGGLTEALRLQAEAEDKGFRTMIGCMSATSLGIAPAFLIAQRAKIIDLDAPLYLYDDRPFPLKYDGSIVFPPSAELWG